MNAVFTMENVLLGSDARKDVVRTQFLMTHLQTSAIASPNQSVAASGMCARKA